MMNNQFSSAMNSGFNGGMNAMSNNGQGFSSFPNAIGRQEQIVKYTYDQNIIKPSEPNITDGRITQHIVIDSRNRDFSKYPDPNNYVVELKGVLDKIVGLTITRYAIPKSGYNVNSSNSNIYFRESDDGDILTATLSDGTYDIDHFIIAIGNAMTNASATFGVGATYTATVDVPSRKITISFTNGDAMKLNIITGCLKYKRTIMTHTPNVAFNCDINTGITGCQVDGDNAPSPATNYNNCQSTALTCDDVVDPLTQEVVDMPNNLGKLMGFKKGIYCSEKGTSGAVTGVCPYNLHGVDYLLLKLNEDLGSESKFEGSSDIAVGTFDVAMMSTANWGVSYQNLGDQYVTGARKLYNPPRDKLIRVRVTFYTPDGELYDFNCQDHMFCLEVDMLNQPNHYKVTDM